MAGMHFFQHRRSADISRVDGDIAGSNHPGNSRVQKTVRIRNDSYAHRSFELFCIKVSPLPSNRPLLRSFHLHELPKWIATVPVTTLKLPRTVKRVTRSCSRKSAALPIKAHTG